MKPEKINGQWRIVYDGHLDWVKRAGLAGKPINSIIFDSIDDAWAYLDKIEDLRGLI